MEAHIGNPDSPKNVDESQVDTVKEPSPKRLKIGEPDADVPEPVQTNANNHDDEVAETVIEVEARLKAKEEILHKLKKVETYKNKWSIEELKNLKCVWKGVATQAFEDLFEKSSAEKESLTKEELLSHLGIDPEMIDVDLDD